MNAAVLSNSYGEDICGALISKELKCFDKDIKIRAFPLISFGKEYKKRNIKVIGGHPPPPSGGFLFKSAKFFFKDIAATFFLPFSYINNLRKFRENTDILIVVGDTPLLLLGYLSFRKKAYFLEICKSGYISPHFAAERFFMRKFTNMVFTHDKITAEDLKKGGVDARFFGNPMIDDLREEGRYSPLQGNTIIGLLPGSRKEAYQNMKRIAEVVKEIFARKNNFCFAVALSDTVDKSKIAEAVPELRRKIDFFHGSFVEIIKNSKLVISMGGTASEQALYLGTPVVSFPGTGAQNTKNRLKGQKKLLGDAFVLLEYKPEKIADKIIEIIENTTFLEELKIRGKKRAGKPGGAGKIADYIYTREKQQSAQ